MQWFSSIRNIFECKMILFLCVYSLKFLTSGADDKIIVVNEETTKQNTKFGAYFASIADLRKTTTGPIDTQTNDEQTMSDTKTALFIPPHVHYAMEEPKEEVFVNNDKCPRYKRIADFNFDQMADVWQVIYYNLPRDISCFKIHIKKNSHKKKSQLRKMYRKLTGDLDWESCSFEIAANEKDDKAGRRHFLCEDAKKNSVMDNIIIVEELISSNNFNSKANINYSLQKENPSQWVVVKNILLTRDCNTGDLVAFSKVPLKPSREDLMDALMVFGEVSSNGEMHCNN